MIRSINNNGTLNVSMFADFVNEIASAELYLSNNIIKRIIELQDNYAEASENPEVLNMELETEVLGMLKDELKRIQLMIFIVPYTFILRMLIILTKMEKLKKVLMEIGKVQ